MEIKKVAILIKTSIQFDGRVISQIESLSEHFNNTEFRIFLLSDGPYNILFSKNCVIDEINLFSRKLPKSNIFQLFKMLEFGVKSFFKIRKFKPDVLHIHDDTSSFGGGLFKVYYPQTKVIYDDHELKYIRSNKLFDKLMFFLEYILYRKSDIVIVANNERRRLSSVIYNRKNIEVHENYFHNRKTKKNKVDSLIKLINKINLLHLEGQKIILHQGQINEVRGLKEFIKLANKLPDNFIILTIGISYVQYQHLLKSVNTLKHTRLIFGGYIEYEHISEVYKIIDYSLIIYKNFNLNNKYCAPNRVYLSYYFGKPIIVNSENHVLFNFIKNTNSGVLLEENSNLDSVFKELDGLSNLTNHSYVRNDINPKKIIDIYYKLIKS